MTHPNLGRELATRREQKGISLRELGSQVGISYQTVLEAERGAATIPTSIRIGKFLGIPLSKLIQLAQADVALIAKSA